MLMSARSESRPKSTWYFWTSLVLMVVFSTAAGFGGDEFVVLLPDLVQLEEALIVADRIREPPRATAGIHLKARFEPYTIILTAAMVIP